MSVVHLVDDDVAVTEACQFLLEGVGYAVQSWNDSQAFLPGPRCMKRAWRYSIYACRILTVTVCIASCCRAAVLWR